MTDGELILNYIQKTIERTKGAPSIREIFNHFDWLSSTSQTHVKLRKLEDAGKIEIIRDGVGRMKPRGIRVIEEGEEKELAGGQTGETYAVLH